MPDLTIIAADWGKKGLRLALMATDPVVVRERRTESTPLAEARGRHADVLESACRDWLAEYPKAPLILSGMVGGRGNWHETAYAHCPIGIDELASAVHRFEIAGHSAAVVPGAAAFRSGIDCDVMRGEEVQILGALALADTGSASFCIPGTNAKWARAEAARLIDFTSYVTGDAYQYFRHTSSVGALADGDEFDAGAFEAGLDHAAAHGLLSAAFAARSATLLGQLPPAHVAACLSGLIIGAEFADARRYQEDGDILLLANGVMAGRYAHALGHFGLAHRLIDAATARQHGLAAIAKMLWE